MPRVHAHAVRAAERTQRPRAPACRRHLRDAAAAPRDGVDLLDEADRSPLVLRRLAQLLEEAAQAHLRHAEVDVLELRGGREQEGHAGLLRHRLGEVRLAGPRRTLEQHAAAGVAAHVLAERLVRQEDVERALHLVHLAVEPDDLVQADLDLLGPDQPHGRLRRRAAEGSSPCSSRAPRRCRAGDDHQRVEVREARECGQPARRPADHPGVDQRQDEDGPGEPHAELAATHALDVGAALQDVAAIAPATGRRKRPGRRSLRRKPGPDDPLRSFPSSPGVRYVRNQPSGTGATNRTRAPFAGYPTKGVGQGALGRFRSRDRGI